MVGQKLFSFPPPGRAHLHEEVLQSIEQSSRKLRVIAIVGEGRAGKSQLGFFATAATPEAVTEGVDIVLDGGRLVLDCEGFNNALASSRLEVLLIGTALASTLIFVMDGKLSEEGLNMLAGALTEAQLLEKQLPTRLVLVVNKCTLDYKASALEDALAKDHGRRDSRDAIKRAFPRRHFVAIPFDPSGGDAYQQGLNALRAALDAESSSELVFDGARLAGAIRGLSIKVGAGDFDLPSIHQHIMGEFLQSEVDAAMDGFMRRIPKVIEYDPDFKVDIDAGINLFDAAIQRLSLHTCSGQVHQFREQLQGKLEERRTANEALGNRTEPWRDVLRRGCALLSARQVGARLVVQRKQDLSPFLSSPSAIRFDTPEPLSVRWMWRHFHPELNPSSHDFAAVLNQHGQVLAVRVPAPALPDGVPVPRGNARHKAALSVSLRSDAWVVVVSQERGETSVACAGQLWDVGSAFPDDSDYAVHEQQRRDLLLKLGLLWESRQISSKAKGLVWYAEEFRFLVGILVPPGTYARLDMWPFRRMPRFSIRPKPVLRMLADAPLEFPAPRLRPRTGESALPPASWRRAAEWVDLELERAGLPVEAAAVLESRWGSDDVPQPEPSVLWPQPALDDHRSRGFALPGGPDNKETQKKQLKQLADNQQRLEELWKMSNSHGISWDELDTAFVAFAKEGKRRYAQWSQVPQAAKAGGDSAKADLPKAAKMKLECEAKAKDFYAQFRPSDEEGNPVDPKRMWPSRVRRLAARLFVQEKKKFLAPWAPGKLTGNLQALVAAKMIRRETHERIYGLAVPDKEEETKEN
ncbi:unnamed protein product [Durusdinium trenchii]|uniref:DAC domain-containing protein n=3 Tax=Durusdinium trenchii TaxID=1381693 RepID=A0ABP0KVR5_9DINO